MKRFTAILLIALLMLGGCGAPAEEEFSAGESTLITAPVETPEETPEDSPEKEDEKTPEETPVETPDTPAETPETPTEKEPEKTPEETPEETPEKGDEYVSVFEDPNYKDWTTSCMSFNVLACNSAGGTYSLPATRAPWILDTITKYEPDLLGCQEVVRHINNVENYDMYTFLTTNLAKLGYDFHGMMDSKDKAGSVVKVADYTVASGLVIFWKKDRFELRDHGVKVYSNDAGRHFQWVKLYDKQEDITILMTNTHMSINPKSGVDDAAKGDAIRAQQANELYQFWYGNCKQGMALYATGDYNHKTNSPAFANMTKGEFVSTREVSQKSNADSWIDHVLINGLVQDCYEYHRCNETYEPAGVTKPNPDRRTIQYCASDHYAVIAYCSNAYR